MYQLPDRFKEAANQKVSLDYASTPFAVFFLIAIVAGVVVGFITNNPLLGGVIVVGLIVIGVGVPTLFARRQKRIRGR